MWNTFIMALVVLPSLVIAIVVHEVAHGYVAKLLGDTTASDRGRLTLNPIRHVDPLGTILLPGALALAGAPVFGYAKPVPVRKSRLRNPRFGMMAVAAAGPLSNFVMAFLGAIAAGLVWTQGADFDQSASVLTLLRSPQGEALWLMSGFYFFILINLFLGLFNLLPIPPFDGSHIVGGLLPAPLRQRWERIQRLGIILILGVIGYSWVFGTDWLIVIIRPLEWVFALFTGLAATIGQL
ncbi:MAG: site-2 protease family protein [Erythrobacter sp.]